MQIRVETVLTVVRNSSAAIGSSVTLTAVMNINGTDVATETTTLTITSDVDSAEYIDVLVSIALRRVLQPGSD